MFKSGISSYISAGDIYPVEVYMEMTDSVNGTKFNSTGNINVVIGLSGIVIIGNITGTNIAFNQDLIIDASQTYDPDLSTTA
jgi:hypothetical protein